MAKIEPGMLCILIRCSNEQNNGKVVTAIKFVGLGSFRHVGGETFRERCWQVDKTLIAWDNTVTEVVSESQLLPITPPDTDKFVLDEVVKELCHVS